MMQTKTTLPLTRGGETTELRPRPRVALSLGDPNGIGPEIVLKCLSESRLLKYMDPLVVGSAHVLQVHASRLGLNEVAFEAVSDVPPRTQQGEKIPVLDKTPDEKPWVSFGEITAEGGRLAMQAVAQATQLCLDGAVDAMVTAPISKEAIADAGYNVPGHSEFIAEQVGSNAFTMMMVADTLRVGLVTGHIPVWDVPKGVTQARILEKVKIISESLRQDFGIERPQIAVLGLNPHAGDGGIMGREEEDTILPAIKQACEEGYLVFGPFAADGFFAVGGYRVYDAVLAMYHDQGLIPFKTLAFGQGVNFTAGLPIIRTSPDHGTAFDIAGEGKASSSSMRSAIYLAIDIARRRLQQNG